MKKTVFAAAAFASLAFGATSANAAKTFDLDGIKFSDGSAITGRITTNDTFTAITSYNVVTTGFLAQTYNQGNGFAFLSSSALLFTAFDFPFSQQLQLNLSKALSAAGVSITGGSESYFIVDRSVARGGTVALAGTGAVPEPATWALMILGMGAVGFAMRRRQKNVTTTVAYAA